MITSQNFYTIVLVIVLSVYQLHGNVNEWFQLVILNDWHIFKDRVKNPGWVYLSCIGLGTEFGVVP